ncbi:MAG TPA: ABC transporter permease [Bryobacteraceae bacterium]|nr:ABC transporter permease [Bryobacteraceae bacterium]
MHWLTSLRLRLRTLFQSRRLERDLEDELAFHLAMRTEQSAAEGMDPIEARHAARRQFGNPLSIRERCRELWRFVALANLYRDLRYARRILSKNPGFTLVAAVTLALGIGANTAVFSVVDAVLLRPLPYPEPDRLGTVITFFRGHGADEDDNSLDGRTWEMMRDQAAFLDSALYSDWLSELNFAAAGRVEYVHQQRVSAGFFRVLGVKPVYGREFTAEEDRDGGPAVAIVTYELWRRALNGDPSAIGRSVMLRGAPHTIVGVMPQGFRTSTPADVWTPLRPSTHGEGEGNNYGLVARLKSGVTWPQADAQVRVIGEARLKEMRNFPRDLSVRFGLVPLQRGLTLESRKPLVIIWMAVGVVLLIACVNIASLLLARAAGRTREIATRMALGGGRAVVVRQLLIESLLLAAIGGALGVALGYLGLDTLEAAARDSLHLWQAIALDRRVFFASTALTVATSVLFGLFPAIQASRMDIRTALVESGGRGVAGGRGRWPRRILVAGEVALGVVLLVGAGLLLRSFLYLRNQRPGFDPQHVITATLSLEDLRYRKAEAVNSLFERSLARIRELPGVESAAVGLAMPYERGLNAGFKRLDGAERDDKFRMTVLTYATPGCFRTLRIPLVSGREFTEADGAQSAKVAIVSQAFARRFFPGQDPLGKHIAAAGGPREIVGLAGDVQMKASLYVDAPVAPMPVIFVPAAQMEGDLLQLHTWFSPSWVVRTSAAPQAVMAAMQRAMEAVEPQLPFSGFHTIGDLRARTLAAQRFQAMLVAIMAALALVLAAVGIYGLIAHSVAERTREMGIRMALGATVREAVSAVALPGIVLAFAGCVIGCVLAAGAVRVLRHLVWGVSTTDPATFAGVALGLLLVAAAASVIPVLRIVRLNPAETLREE